jgi:hypothetical protein
MDADVICVSSNSFTPSTCKYCPVDIHQRVFDDDSCTGGQINDVDSYCGYEPEKIDVVQLSMLSFYDRL